jgi:hypothetical protein
MSTQIPNTAAFQMISSGIVPALGLDMAFTPADTVNGNSFQTSGNDLLIVYNSDSVAHTFTLTSAADQYGRFATFTYTVGAGVYSLVNITPTALYTQGGTGLVLMTGSDTHIQFLVIMNA